jgi:sodium/proline symporter
MTTELFPAVFTGIFLVIVLAASMSTVDSLVIMASSAIARDVIQKIFKPDLTQSHVSTIGKVTTVVIGIFGVAFAIGEVPLIFWLVLFAWAGLASAFTPVVLCSLFWKRTTRAGAIAGMIAGFTTAVVFVLPGVKALTHDLYEMIPGFAAGFAACIAVSLFTQPPSDGVPEFDEVASVVGPPFG